MHQTHPAVRQQGLGNVLVVGLDRVQPAVGGVLNGGAHQIDLPPLVDLLIEEMVQVPPFFAGDAPGLDRGTAGGQLVQNGDVQVSVEEQAQCAGNGGGAHDQQVRIHGLFGQHAALPHAEAVLLVDDGQPQPGKLHPLAEDGVGAHDEVRFVAPDGGQRGALCSGFHAAGEQGHPHAKGGQHPVQTLGVLCGQNLSGGQQSSLISGPDAGPDGGSRYQRFAAAHVTL